MRRTASTATSAKGATLTTKSLFRPLSYELVRPKDIAAISVSQTFAVVKGDHNRFRIRVREP
ncbi:MAG: hypothetical protein DMF63_09830 [Acidobacteria bacterium]|nr:MAG: hypothetical protein DMF63_09830 [Acidobacteriota bacterium]